MNPGNAIEVKNVKKRFKVYMDKGSSMKEKMLFRNRNRYEERWVLKGVSFEVKKGEAIGLIGKNGCGKSTTLKMLTRIMYPTEGTIELKGRVSSLIELGAGFHPDMSGRENIFTNASIFGLNHKEIEKRLDNIIGFSELEEFIDNPVRTYSSGMYMRLAFAVAINVDADILLIDEILAVGDISFQKKCFEKLKEIKKKGTTIAIVSHVMAQIEQICDRAIWIEEGLIKKEGKPRDIGESYLASMEEKRLKKAEDEYQNKKNEVEQKNTKALIDKKSNTDKLKKTDKEKKEGNQKQIQTGKDVAKQKKEKLPKFCDISAIRYGNKNIEIVDFKIFNSQKIDKIVYNTGENIEFTINYKCNASEEADFRIGIARDDGIHCFGISSYNELKKPIEIEEDGSFSLILEDMPLLPGKYWIDIGIRSKTNDALDVIQGIRFIQVKKENCYESGITHIKHRWFV